MSVALNIKNDETEQLVRKLADLTGESMTAAIAIAVQERHDRLRADAGASGGVAEQLLAIGRDVASRIPAAERAVDHAALLYGDDGLPR